MLNQRKRQRQTESRIKETESRAGARATTGIKEAEDRFKAEVEAVIMETEERFKRFKVEVHVGIKEAEEGYKVEADKKFKKAEETVREAEEKVKKAEEKVKEAEEKVKKAEASIEYTMCLDPLFVKPTQAEVVSTVCGHIYHRKCLLDYFRVSKRECPNCRRTLSHKNSWKKVFIV